MEIFGSGKGRSKAVHGGFKGCKNCQVVLGGSSINFFRHKVGPDSAINFIEAELMVEK